MQWSSRCTIIVRFYVPFVSDNFVILKIYEMTLTFKRQSMRLSYIEDETPLFLSVQWLM